MNMRPAKELVFMIKTGIITVEHAFLYNSPHRSCETSGIVDDVFMGWAVEIISQGNDYAEIRTHYGYSGYLPLSCLQPIENSKLKERDESGTTVVVTRMCTDLRSIPDVKGCILHTLERGCFVTIELWNKEKNYYRASTADGLRGYIPAVDLALRKDTDRFLYEQHTTIFFINKNNCSKNTVEKSETEYRDEITANAMKYLGSPYRWGGKSSLGLDCSGLAFMSYLLSGLIIYRDAEIKPDYPVKEIPLKQVKKGDLLYFPGHIALSLGNKKFIHSTGYADSFGCVINSLDPLDTEYRKDLEDSFLKAGSIF